MIPSGSPLDALIILHVSSTHFLLVPQFFITGHLFKENKVLDWDC